MEALFFAKAAYTYADHYCCNDNGKYHFSKEKCRGEEVKREDCNKNPQCKKNCEKMYTETHAADIGSDDEWNDNMGQLIGLKRHLGTYIWTKNLLVPGHPFGFTAYVGSTIVIAFKGSNQ